PSAGRTAGRRTWPVGPGPPAVAPRPLLFALAGDHLGGRPGDEVLVRELRAECPELLVEPGELAREPAAFLLHVDLALERDEHVAAVRQRRVCTHAGACTVQRE